jgi:hypothetical protein
MAHEQELSAQRLNTSISRSRSQATSWHKEKDLTDHADIKGGVSLLALSAKKITKQHNFVKNLAAETCLRKYSVA